MEKLDFEYFFKDSFESINEDDKNRLCATGLITTNQNIQVLNRIGTDAKWNYNPGFGFHFDTLNDIFTEMYDIDTTIFIDDFDTEEKISKIAPDREKNYVFIRYIHYEDNKSYVIINIPKFVNSYQYDEMKRLKEIYKSFENVEVDACITNFNPISQIEEGIDFTFFEGKEDNLGNALDYLKSNDRIKEFEHPIKNEKIISKNNMSFK